MSNTNQICITCTQRDTCQYYGPNRTICVPVNVSDYGQFAGSLQPTIDWQHYRIKAAIAAMQGMLANPEHHKIQVESGVPFSNFYAVNARLCADALVAELKKEQE